MKWTSAKLHQALSGVTMLRRLIALLIGLSACSEPLAPGHSPSSSISFRAISIGDTLYIDQHSVGCFSISDSHLLFVGTAAAVVVCRGAISSTEFATSVRRAAVPDPLLTNRELGLPRKPPRV